ncbi:SOS response associated peptidase (SRAP) [Trema orientale]|uniref:SOS response associated peptidase (SRAP) n=1 Tax=Trema orientale TaxID=63057 RepID=A0A2P5CY47_TREOI|nr:SOS response associated peptidase (SRAP) [Trema orientale]
MCGRARCSLRADDIPRACRRNDGPVRTIHMDRYRPSYNVSPGSNIPVVRREDGSDGVVLHCMKWGLIPSFTKKTEKPDHYKMFNARSESISEKASFRRLIPKSRCLVAVEGFYEWKKDGSKKQPYYINFKDGRPLVFAALYDSWENSEGEILDTFTIITTSSSSALQWLHDRMPVIYGDKESSDAWLTGSSSKVDTLLKPYENPDLIWYPVTAAMGKPSFDGPECIKEIKLKTDGNMPISKFFSTKGIKKEAELNSDEKVVKVDTAKCLKEEPESRENTETSLSTEKEEPDSKSSVSSFPREGAENCQMKRDHEELSSDSKLTKDEANKLSTSPGRKKVKLKSAGDYKQPSVLSYFGKK